MKLFIGSSNKGKIADYKMYFKDFDTVSSYDLNITLNIPENTTSLLENSINKATAWAKTSGLTTIADDTGFYILALDCKPGVSIKRWGGELEKELTNKEFIAFLKSKLEGIDDTTCYFETYYTIAHPDGRAYSFSRKYHGTIDKSLFDEAYTEGFPLGAVFKTDGRGTTWMQMNEKEKIDSEEGMIKHVKKVLPLFNS